MPLWQKIYYRLCSNSRRIAFLRKRGVHIGKRCVIPGTSFFGSEPFLVKLGDNVRLTAHVEFITHDGGCWVVRNYNEQYKACDLFSPITVGNNVHIGIGTIVMPGVHIGNNVIIGCGAIVTRDIPDNSVAAGVPCRVIRSIDDYIAKHKQEFLYTNHLSPQEKRIILLKKFKV